MPEQQTVSPDEVERMMRNLCAYALSEPDPLQRYLNLTHQQAVFAGVVTALATERGNALAELAESGASLDRIVADSGLPNPAQVRNLVRAAGRKLPRARSSKTGAATTAKSKLPAKSMAPRMPVLPSTTVAVGGSRVLTDEERAAIGLPPAGIGALSGRGRRDRG